MLGRHGATTCTNIHMGRTRITPTSNGHIQNTRQPIHTMAQGDIFSTVGGIGRNEELAEEWMSRLWIKATQCNYKENDSWL